MRKNKNDDVSDAGNYRPCFTRNNNLLTIWTLHMSCISPVAQREFWAMGWKRAEGNPLDTLRGSLANIQKKGW